MELAFSVDDTVYSTACLYPFLRENDSTLYDISVCRKYRFFLFQGGNHGWDERATAHINVPKYIFVLTKNVSAFINFCLTLVIFFIFTVIDHVPFSLSFFSIIIPIVCLMLFNFGVGMILSALYIFFRDTGYLYDVFLTLLMYLSAIFYNVDSFPVTYQRLFLMNPVYCYIKFFRVAVIDGHMPSLVYTVLCFGYAILAVGIGIFIYHKKNHEFLYYV